jgi:hypothetical protein
MHLKPLVAAAIMAAGALSTPVSTAIAEEDPTCLQKAIAECNKEFPPNDYYLIAIRGWCYIIHGAICAAT